MSFINTRLRLSGLSLWVFSSRTTGQWQPDSGFLFFQMVPQYNPGWPESLLKVFFELIYDSLPRFFLWIKDLSGMRKWPQQSPTPPLRGIMARDTKERNPSVPREKTWGIMKADDFIILFIKAQGFNMPSRNCCVLNLGSLSLRRDTYISICPSDSVPTGWEARGHGDCDP